jgi:putative membrane protein
MMNKTWMLFVSLLIIALTWVNPIWPQEQALHNSLTVIAFIALAWYNKTYQMSRVQFGLICLFLIVHSIAARWLYSYVPYEQWFADLTGTALFHTERNHTDRLIHLLYGVCFTPTLISYFQQRYQLNTKTAYKLSLMMIMVTSLCYEWFEWLIAISLSPEQAEAYNGQQGDMWDAHKDMLLATMGCLVWWPIKAK